MQLRKFFSRFAMWISCATGHPLAFLIALAIVIVWAVTGPIFHFNDSWQLVINTGTTIVTFLMVFLIQHSQNLSGQAIQLKLDELIRSVEGAHNAIISLEDLSEEELNRVRAEYAALADRAREEAQNGRADTDTPIINVPVEKPIAGKEKQEKEGA